jgi:hypothetical protein
MNNFVPKFVKFLQIIWIVCVVIFQCEANKISCESVHTDKFINFGNLTSCILNETTVIDDATTTFKYIDDSINALWFIENKHISFLPIKVSRSFPHLILYAASACSIKQVSKVHFKRLTSLKGLYLGYNEIKVIHDNTFSDLKSLEFLDLCKILMIKVDFRVEFC